MSNSKYSQGLGITTKGKEVLLYRMISSPKGEILQLEASSNGFDFYSTEDSPSITNNKNEKENLKNCQDFRITELENQRYCLTYKRKSGKKISLYGAVSSDLIRWEKSRKIAQIGEAGMIAPLYRYKGQYVLFFGEQAIKVALSPDLTNWEVRKEVLLLPKEIPGNIGIIIGNIFTIDDGIILIYYEERAQGTTSAYSIRMALFDKESPTKLLRTSEKPIWQQPREWLNKKVAPLGLVIFSNKLISYWQVEGEGIFTVAHSLVRLKADSKAVGTTPVLKKSRKNPLLRPQADHFWESQAVFNPAAVRVGGKVHLVYRAVGDTGVSVLGHAASQDGLHIDERSEEPIYAPREPFESNLCAPHSFHRYMSGGGCGGCEDPRITKIDEKLYMTYVAFDGWSPPRVALTSIGVDDFSAKRWDSWEKPVLISPPGVVDKNACILPEKINGKYVIFHRVFPDILVDFVDSLNFDGNTWLKGEFRIKPRRGYWDSRKIGVGAPPIKTEDGWLVIYQAVTDGGNYHYKIGAMVLDAENPTRVLYRSVMPVLEATEHYEVTGYKPGVVYPCGAVTLDNQLFVYYGGADEVVCVATAHLGHFLEQLKNSESAQLTPVTSQVHPQTYH